jgi:hypothetical protein
VKHFLKYLIFLVAIATVSCDSSDQNPQLDTGKEYYPLRKGMYQIYDVLEIHYTLGVPETLRYELRTEVTDSFPNAEGGFSYVVQRSKKEDGQSDFLPLNTWSSRIESHQVVTQEENISFVKISLPILKDDEWDGNLYNTIGEDTYLMEEVKTATNVNDITYSDCIVVNQNDNQDFVVFLDQRKEIYARHAGLIFKESRLLSYCTVGPCLGQQEIESGIVYTQSIKSYGVE